MKDADDLNAKFERLKQWSVVTSESGGCDFQGMAGNKMAPDLAQWVNQRTAILKKLLANKSQKSEL
eukprot:9493346-Pyramimonas_sp.AAC.3